MIKYPEMVHIKAFGVRRNRSPGAVSRSRSMRGHAGSISGRHFPALYPGERPGNYEYPEINEVDILLVEDNPYDAELTHRALKSKGLAHKLLTCSDGVEALDFLFGNGMYAGRNLTERPKVIFLDLKLPRVNGLEVLQRIKADERTRTIPVVILTSSQEELDIARSYDLGVNSYMVKPVDFDKFFQVVEELGLYWLLLNKVPN